MLARYYDLLSLTKQLRIIVILTLFDLLMTLVWVLSGTASEANPIMAYMLNKSALAFGLSKLVLSLGSIWILFKYQTSRLVQYAVPIIFLLYFSVSVHHCVGFLGSLNLKLG